MSPLMVMAVQSTCSLAVFTWFSLRHLRPRMVADPVRWAVVPFLWLNVFRFIPLVLFAPGQVAEGVPQWARAVIAYGDLTSAAFAALALALHFRRSRLAVASTWLFLVVGGLDALAGLASAMTAQLHRFALGASWFVVVLFVPLIVVSQGLLARGLLDLRELHRMQR